MYGLVLIRTGSPLILRSVSFVGKVTSTNGFTSSCFILTVLNCRDSVGTATYSCIRAAVINHVTDDFPRLVLRTRIEYCLSLLSASSQLAPTAAEVATKYKYCTNVHFHDDDCN